MSIEYPFNVCYGHFLTGSTLYIKHGQWYMYVARFDITVGVSDGECISFFKFLRRYGVFNEV